MVLHEFSTTISPALQIRHYVEWLSNEAGEFSLAPAYGKVNYTIYCLFTTPKPSPRPPYPWMSNPRPSYVHCSRRPASPPLPSRLFQRRKYPYQALLLCRLVRCQNRRYPLVIRESYKHLEYRQCRQRGLGQERRTVASRLDNLSSRIGEDIQLHLGGEMACQYIWKREG